MTLADEKKGITVKIDADLHAEVREYIEQHGMTMAEFITLAVDNELHPKYQNKEEKNMGNMRTMAFQVPEELFQRIKGYLQRNNMSQKQFVLGLIEAELDREQAQRNGVTEDQQTGGVDTEEGISNDPEAVDGTGGDGTDEDETEDESEDFGMSMKIGILYPCRDSCWKSARNVTRISTEQRKERNISESSMRNTDCCPLTPLTMKMTTVLTTYRLKPKM